jgi:hypothetical protein
VLSAILRKRLAELSGLPEEDLRGLLAATGPREAPAPESPIRATNVARPARAPAPRMPVRRPPSLTRQLIQGLLLRPGLARSLAFPPPDESTPEAAALTALVAFCAEAEGPLTTAAVTAAFAGTPHTEVFAAMLAAASDQRLDEAALEAEVRDGLDRWWQQARRTGMPAPPADVAPEEDRRLQQLDYVRRRAAEHAVSAVPGATDTPPFDQGPRDII